MADIPSLPLKVVFFVHLLLSTWAMQGSWLPQSYLYYNVVFLITLLWALHHKDSDEPVFMALIINIISIILDVVVIAVFCRYDPSSYEQFTIAFSILNLIFRLVSSLILFRTMNERSGTYSSFGVPNFSSYFGGNSGPLGSGGGNRGPYENIDQPVPQSVPQNTIDPYSPQHKSPYMSGGGPVLD